MNAKKVMLLGSAFFAVNTFATVGYHSGQQTAAAAKYWRDNPVDTLFVSSPDNNRPKGRPAIDAWAETKAVAIDQPVFGAAVNNAAVTAGEYGVFHKLEVEGFVIGKLKKGSHDPLLKELDSRGLVEISRRIQAYVADIIARGHTIKSQEAWEAFLLDHKIAGDMKLDWAVYLDNFDFEKVLTPEVRNAIGKTVVGQDEHGKDENINKKCIRWLAKAVYKPSGCFTDVANFLAIDEKEELPSVFMMDAQNDDMAVYKMLKAKHKKAGTELKVIVQLPVDPRLDLIAKMFKEQKFVVVRDPDHTNVDAIFDHWVKVLRNAL